MVKTVKLSCVTIFDRWIGSVGLRHRFLRRKCAEIIQLA